MENKNKVATVRKEGVSDSGKPNEAINEAKGMDANGGVWKWILNTFGWLWINDNGKTIFDKTPKSESANAMPSKSQSQVMPIASGFVILPTLFGGVVYPLFDDPEIRNPSSASCNHHLKRGKPL